MVLNVDTKAVVGDIPNTSGVHGIALAPDLNRGFTSNGTTGTVTIFRPDHARDTPPPARCSRPSRYVFAPNGADGTLTVVHEDSPDTYSVVQTVTTQAGAGTMALDSTNHLVFTDTADPNISGSFAVLVFGR